MKLQKYFFYVIGLALYSCQYSYEETNKETSVAAAYQQIADNHPDAYSELPDTLELRLIALGLVDIQLINSKVRVELKYSSEDNFMKTNVYGKLKKAYLQKEVAEMLSKAQENLSNQDSNLYLLVYDDVRPVWVQWKMWNMLDSIPVHQRSKFLSNPKNKSVHNYGSAVDLTICDSAGIPLDMGAGFDDSREIAYPSMEHYYLSKGLLTQVQVDNRKLLRAVMKSAGFRNIETEWWHFNAFSRNVARKKYKVVD